MSLSDFVHQNPDFEEMYGFADANEDIIKSIAKINSSNYYLRVFASKNCQYCMIYLPKLLKIHEIVKFNIELIIWEDYTDDEQYELMEKYDLLGLPSIIVYTISEDKELGRIYKQPNLTLEEDLLIILRNIYT